MMRKRKYIKSMQVLKYIENNFDKQPLRIKIELLVLPFLILFLCFYFSKDENIQTQEIIVTSKDLIPKKMDKKLIEIIKDIEKYCKEKNIKLKSISSSNKEITLQIEIKQAFLYDFFYFIENYNSFSNIKEFKFAHKDLHITLEFKKFYLKNKLKKKVLRSGVKLSLNAIIDDKVFINNKWLKTGDKIGGFQIWQIKSNLVTLKNKNKLISLRLFKNEKF